MTKQKANQYGFGAAGWSGSWGYRGPSCEKMHQTVEPLLEQMERLDEFAAKLRQGSATVGELRGLQQLLTTPITLNSDFGRPVSLADPSGLRSALDGVSPNLHLEIHSMDDRLPCYLLCRIYRTWDGPDLILDELYVSPRNDFFSDRRFVVLTRASGSRTFLRLSVFRDAAQRYLRSRRRVATDLACDELLKTAGTLVLASGWYEDQRLPLHVADVFGLTHFAWTSELIGFTLGSDLYGVANALREHGRSLVGFFRHVHRNPCLARLLITLVRGKPPKAAELEDAARQGFTRLNAAFDRFLCTTGALRDLERMPLYQIVVGLYYGLKEVADTGSWMPALHAAVLELEREAQTVAHAVLAET